MTDNPYQSPLHEEVPNQSPDVVGGRRAWLAALRLGPAIGALTGGLAAIPINAAWASYNFVQFMDVDLLLAIDTFARRLIGGTIASTIFGAVYGVLMGCLIGFFASTRKRPTRLRLALSCSFVVALLPLIACILAGVVVWSHGLENVSADGKIEGVCVNGGLLIGSAIGGALFGLALRRNGWQESEPASGVHANPAIAAGDD